MKESHCERAEFARNSTASFIGMVSELTSLKGYREAAITTHDGELLYSNTSDTSESRLYKALGVLNKLFGLACNSSERSGYTSCHEFTFRTEDECIVIRCSGHGCLVGIRIFVLIEEQPDNMIFLHSRLEDLLPGIIQNLTWREGKQQTTLLARGYRRKRESAVARRKEPPRHSAPAFRG